MANAWFETVAVAQRRARKRLPKSVYGALIAGSERGVTVRDNVRAFGELGFAPHIAGLAATARPGHHGHGPADLDARDHLADRRPGRAPRRRGGRRPGRRRARHRDGPVSSFASKPVEEVVAANPQTFFQIYWVGTRDDMVAADGAGPRGRRGRA